jgi:hypothetical protein
MEYQDESKVIMKSIAQKVMANSSLEHRFHDLKYFEVGFFFFISLDFTRNFKTSLQKFAKTHQL